MPGPSVDSQLRQAYERWRAGDAAAALSAAHQALTAGSLTTDQLTFLATIFAHGEDPEQALALYRRASRADPRNVQALRGLAITLRVLGQIDAAEGAASALLAIDPGDHEMWLLRSSLRRQTETANHVEQIEAVLRGPVSSWRGAVQLRYALAKELEDLGRYEESFAQLQRGARLKREHLQYDVAVDVGTLRDIRLAFSRETIARLQGHGHPSNEPIFVLGLPRTGSTLIERIICAHPEVRSAGELHSFALELLKLTTAANAGRPVERASLPQASTQVRMHELGASYLEAARSAHEGRAHFVDKMPMNALYIGLIHLALPNAKIVLVERDTVDSCYAMYKFLFRDAYPFSYDLEELATYYLAHQELMMHWRSVLPANVLCHVQYEALVSAPEQESRRIVQELGLAWSDSCLAFPTHGHPSTTGSASQVRQPIYRSSVGLWRHYRWQLEPLLRVLEKGGVRTT